MHTKSVPSLALALILGIPLTAFAAPNEATLEAAALANETVSAGDAIAAVEAKGTGKVVEFTLLSESTVSVYHVTTLLPDGTETNYAVDARTGAVVATIDAQENQGDGVGEYADDKPGYEQGDGDGETSDDGDVGDGDGETNDDGAN